MIIAKLPEDTIRLIAAGEVIRGYYNVVKEICENSIDASASHIRVQIGPNFIEVIDNGHGIAKVNAELLCQRYTTSKLTQADDLTRLNTFGFRGEALSSISEVANIDVSSFNMKTDKMGWHGKYRQSKLIECAEKYIQLPGTVIRVSNLFVSRKSNFSEDRKIIMQLVAKLAIHHRSSITFILNDKSSSDLICSIAPVEMGPCIGNFYGVDMENNLLEFSLKEEESCKVDLHIAFTYKKAVSGMNQSNLILFANNRLVDCDELKKEVAGLILEYFSNKQYFSLIYIELKVPPKDIDVNTHPAKASVTLHYQQEIIKLILTNLRVKFDDNLSSQVVPNKVNLHQKTIGELIRAPGSSQKSQQSSPSINEERLRHLAPGSLPQSQSIGLRVEPSGQSKRPYELVHTDHNQPTMSEMFDHKKVGPPTQVKSEVKFHSIRELRDKVASETSKDPKCVNVIKKSVFVGIFDYDHALIQCETMLYAINLRAFLKEQIYQFYLIDFANFPPIDILPPGNKIQFMLDTYLIDIKKHDVSRYDKLKYKTSKEILDELEKHSEMLADYLTVKFTREEILSIPNIIPDYVPNLAFLGKFICDLANDVDYSNELDCFHQMGRTLADFYSRPPINLKDLTVHRRYHELVEMKLYRAIKMYLLVPDWLFTSHNIRQITDTRDLYKVFERC